MMRPSILCALRSPISASRNAHSGAFSSSHPHNHYQHLPTRPATHASRLANTSHVLRRWHTSKPPPAIPPVGHQAPSSAKTIPGPTWLWLEPIYEPFRAYGRAQQRRPYRTQLLSSLVIYFVGDLVAQSIAGPPATTQMEETAVVAAMHTPSADGGVEEEEEAEEDKGWMQAWLSNRDWARTARALVIGGISSIPSYRWFLWLGNNFNYASKIVSLSVKVAVNQTLFTPLFNTYFFGMHSLLSGASLSATVERVKNTVPTSCINSCKLWPAVTAFSFTYIPVQYRSIFGGVVAVGWQTYLNLLDRRAAAKESGVEVEVEKDTGSMMRRRVEARGEPAIEDGKCAA